MKIKLLFILIFLLGNHFIISQTALDFNASNKVVLLSPSYSLSGSYTLEARFKAPLPTKLYNTLFRGLNSHHPILTGNGFLGAFDNGSCGCFISTGFDMASLSAGWHHIAVVCSSGNSTFYIDGVNVGTVAFQSDDTIYAIGNYQGGGQNFGSVDDARIWNYARSENEIQNDMDICLTGTESGLVAYYDFEDGTGSSTLTDLTGNGYNGTLTNMDTISDWINGYECTALGIDSIDNWLTFSIYPIPSSGTFYIKTDFDGDFFIFNQLGQTVYSFKGYSNVEKIISMENLANGVYYLKGNGENKIVTKKLIIKK